MSESKRAEVTITCPNCTSAIHVYPDSQASLAQCGICQAEVPVKFSAALVERAELDVCPCCGRKDFFKQKDFNRKVGVVLYVIAAILSIWTYGLSLLALYLVDLFLFRRVGDVASCYKCETLFRQISNMEAIGTFNHEMHDRIVYSDHNFEGKTLEH